MRTSFQDVILASLRRLSEIHMEMWKPRYSFPVAPLDTLVKLYFENVVVTNFTELN